MNNRNIVTEENLESVMMAEVNVHAKIRKPGLLDLLKALLTDNQAEIV